MLEASQQLNDLSTLAGRWTLDPERTLVEFHTKLARVFTVKGTIKAIEGGASVGADGAIVGTFVLDAVTIETGIKRRDAHLRSADFFDADRYPQIVFTAQSARRVPSGRFEVVGSLNLHGEARSLTVVAGVQPGSGEATVSATNIDIIRTAWGVGRRGFGPATTTRVVVVARFVKD